MNDTAIVDNTPEPSAPEPAQETSTASIAKSVMERAETPQEPTPAADPTPAPEPELSPAAKFLLEQGHKMRTDDGKDVWLKAKTIEGILDRYVTSHRSTWDTERGTLVSERDQAKAAVQGYLEALRGDPRAFLHEIATHDPRYSSFLQPAPAAPVQVPDDRPQPDVDLGNGRKTYSLDGIDKLLEWKTNQLLNDRLKPLEQRDKEAKERADAERAHTQLVERTRTQIETAKTWQNWAEWEPDILKKLQDDSAAAAAKQERPTMTLREAYLEVKAEKLTAERNSVRGSVLEELQHAPKGTSVQRAGAEVVKQPGPLTTADIARRVIARGDRQSA